MCESHPHQHQSAESIEFLESAHQIPSLKGRSINEIATVPSSHVGFCKKKSTDGVKGCASRTADEIEN